MSAGGNSHVAAHPSNRLLAGYKVSNCRLTNIFRKDFFVSTSSAKFGHFNANEIQGVTLWLYVKYSKFVNVHILEDLNILQIEQWLPLYILLRRQLCFAMDHFFSPKQYLAHSHLVL